MADLVRRATLIVQFKDELSAGARSAADSLDKADEKSKRHAETLNRLGNIAKTAAVAGFGALTAAVIASVKSAGEFETSFAKIAGLTNTSSESIKGLRESVIGLSRDLPVSANDLAKGLYYISSSGYQGAEAMKILEMSAKASAAGLGETRTIADAVTSALNAYGLSGSEAARITDVLTKAVIEGKGEPAELAASLGRVLPVAAAAGVSMEQVGASLAIMTRTGLSADEAATALRGTIGALLAPTKQSKDALANLGISTDQIAAMLKSDGGLVSVLDLLMKKTGGNIEELDKIIPNIRALTGVLSSAGSQGAEYARVLGEMENAAGSTEKAYSKMADTFEFKLKKAQNSLENLGIAVGNKLLPELSKAADAAAVLINWQDKMAEALNGVNKNLQGSSKNYTEYINAMLDTAVAAGKITPAMAAAAKAGGLVTVNLQEQRDIMPEVIARTGLLTEEQYNLARSQAAVDKGAANLAETQDVIQAAMMGTKSAVEDAGKAMGGLARKQIDLAAATEIMKAGYGGAVSKEMKEYSSTQDELKTKAAKLKEEIDKLTAAHGSLVMVQSRNSASAADMNLWTLQLADAQKKLADETNPLKQAKLAVTIETLNEKLGRATGAVGSYVDNSKKIGELTAEYDAVNAKIAENAAAHDEAMKRIVLDIATQQLAADGWTQTEITAFTTVATQMGVFDEASATMVKNVLGATGQLAADGNAQAFADNLGWALDSATGKTAETINVVKAQMNALGIPTIDTTGYEKSMDSAKNTAVATGQTIATTLPVTIAALATDPNIQLFSTNFGVSMTATQTKTTETAQQITTTLPPTIAALATDPNMEAFAGAFDTAMGKVVESAGLAEQGNKELQKSIEALKSKTITITTIFKTIGTPVGGDGGGEGKGYQKGADFTVPPGYPNDTYPLRVTSGEHVVVTPRGRPANTRVAVNAPIQVTINAAAGQNPQEIAHEVSIQLGKRLRGALSSAAGMAGG